MAQSTLTEVPVSEIAANPARDAAAMNANVTGQANAITLPPVTVTGQAPTPSTTTTGGTTDLVTSTGGPPPLDRRERLEDLPGSLEEALLGVLRGHQAQIWTAIPCQIQAYNASANTVKVQPVIQGEIRKPSGQTQFVNLPYFDDVPVFYPSGGGFSLSFPLKEGDECLVVFSCRNIDLWWKNGGIQKPNNSRMHDIADGFAIVGFRSQAKKLSQPSTNSAQLRSDDGKTYLELAANGVCNIVSAGKCSITAQGDVEVNSKGSTTVNSSGNTHIDASGNVVLNNGSQQIARFGDTVICPAGHGRITSGAARSLA